MKLFQRWLAAACIGAGLSAPASANTIVTFSVDNVTFAGLDHSGIGSTFLMQGTFDWDQTANTLSSNFNLTFPNHVPLSPIWTTNFFVIGNDGVSQIFGFRDDSGNVGTPPDFISFSFLHHPDAPFLAGQTFSVGEQYGTFANELNTCGPLLGGGCGPNFDLTSADSTLVVTNVVSTTPLPATLPLFASGLAGLGWLARRRRKHAAA
jgi:hypothetical protein